MFYRDRAVSAPGLQQSCPVVSHRRSKRVREQIVVVAARPPACGALAKNAHEQHEIGTVGARRIRLRSTPRIVCSQICNGDAAQFPGNRRAARIRIEATVPARERVDVGTQRAIALQIFSTQGCKRRARDVALRQRKRVGLILRKVPHARMRSALEQLLDAPGTIRRSKVRTQPQRVPVSVHAIVGGKDLRRARPAHARQRIERDEGIERVRAGVHAQSPERIARNESGQLIRYRSAAIRDDEVLRRPRIIAQRIDRLRDVFRSIEFPERRQWRAWKAHGIPIDRVQDLAGRFRGESVLRLVIRERYVVGDAHVKGFGSAARLRDRITIHDFGAHRAVGRAPCDVLVVAQNHAGCSCERCAGNVQPRTAQIDQIPNARNA